MNLEEKIKWIREKEGLSQEGFAERLSTSRQSVINWEKGKSTPSFEILMIIANEFHIEINSLVQKDRDVLYLTEQEKEMKEVRSSIKAFDSSIKPLYLCKKNYISNLLPRMMLIVLLFIPAGGLLNIFILDKQKIGWVWLCLVLGIFFFLFLLYSFVDMVLEILKFKASRCYFYENYYYIQNGLSKEKRTSGFNIDYYEDIRIEQTLLGKLFNYGNIEIYFHPHMLTIWECKKPYKLKKFIQDTYPCKEDFTEK